MNRTRWRRLRLVVGLIIALLSVAGYQVVDNLAQESVDSVEVSAELASMYQRAAEEVATLEVKGRAPKTDYDRELFGGGWSRIGVCDMRNIILNRDLVEVEVDDDCKVTAGKLNDPYTGKVVDFQRGSGTSSQVQIDHVVALSDAWQKGAQGMSFERRVEFSNDPLNLLAVTGSANQEKSDGDAATWLPSNKAFRCQYVSRQVRVKVDYKLWVTPAEKAAILRVLEPCLNS